MKEQGFLVNSLYFGIHLGYSSCPNRLRIAYMYIVLYMEQPCTETEKLHQINSNTCTHN